MARPERDRAGEGGEYIGGYRRLSDNVRRGVSGVLSYDVVVLCAAILPAALMGAGAGESSVSEGYFCDEAVFRSGVQSKYRSESRREGGRIYVASAVYEEVACFEDVLSILAISSIIQPFPILRGQQPRGSA